MRTAILVVISVLLVLVGGLVMIAMFRSTRSAAIGRVPSPLSVLMGRDKRPGGREQGDGENNDGAPGS